MKKTQMIFAVLAMAATVSAEAAPTNLRVDYVRVPEQTTISSEQPIFSWQIDQGVQQQSGYEIMVSTDAACRKGDVWSSGQVASDNSSAVLYEGAALETSQNYYWRVRSWDKRDKKSKFSKVQSFRMATDDERGQSIVTANPLLLREDVPVGYTQVADREYLYDFGRAAFGTLRFEFKATKDATLHIVAGEQLTVEGRIERNPKGEIRCQEVTVDLKRGESLYDVLFAADKRNTSDKAIPVPEEWGGVILPFRYVEVCGVSEAAAAEIRLVRDVMHGYNEPLGNFSSSNALLDSIWEISRYTIEATDFLGYYIDGDREHIPYEADAYINQLGHYGIDAEYAIGKRTLEYFMTHATWPTEWLLHTIMIAYQDYIHTGDTRLITQYYDKLKAKSLHELSREDGLISASSPKVTKDYLESIGFQKWGKMRDIVDWPDPAFAKGVPGEVDGHVKKHINTVVNCFFYHAMLQMAEIAEVTGHLEDSEYFAAMAARVKASINEKLFDTERGVYIDGEGTDHSSLHSNMFALAFGVVEEQNIKSVAEFVKSRGMACSVYGAQYLFEALYAAGEAQYALDLMTNRSDRGWYHMIRLGSTMTLEAWDIKYKNNLDWNHAWGAAPANLIPRQMWGIVPTAAGYREARIKPQLANLETSSISVPTLQGVIRAEYRLDGDSKRYEVTIPANMKAVFELSSGETVELSVGKNIIVD